MSSHYSPKNMSEGQITMINSKKEYNDLILSKLDGLIVVDFSADWCGPCREMAPIYQKFSKEFKKVIFASVDADEHEDIAENEGVTVMPVFIFYKLGKMIDQVTGANEQQLREKLEIYRENKTLHFIQKVDHNYEVMHKYMSFSCSYKQVDNTTSGYNVPAYNNKNPMQGSVID